MICRRTFRPALWIHFHRVVVRSSPLDSSATSTTIGPDGAVTNQVKSTKIVTPLPLPAS
jgi:hypothetical protein